jgi:hypothetical protein
MAINLSRNTRVWASTVKTGHNNSNTFEIPVQEGYSLSQAVSTADVSVEETGAEPTRGSKRFNSSLDPVEWAFATYFNPYVGTDTKHYTTDMLIWHALATKASVAPDLDNSNTGSLVYGDSTHFRVGFGNNSAHVLTKLFLYFKIDNDIYLVEDAQVSQAEISIDIADLAMVSWTGNGTVYNRLSSSPAFVSAAGAEYDELGAVTDSFVKVPAVKEYLVNKLTTMDFRSDVSGTNLYYSMPITSGSITINNNITFLTPNTLAVVDTAVGSFTGSFEVTGTLDAYMRDTGGNGVLVPDARGTTELLEDMLGNTGQITNTTDVTFNIGGLATGDAGAKITMPTVHVSVPSLSVDDVVSTSIEFKAIPSDSNMKSGTELAIEITASNA